MLSPSVVYNRTPKTVASTSVVTPILAALWLIDKDFQIGNTRQDSSIPARVHMA